MIRTPSFLSLLLICLTTITAHASSHKFAGRDWLSLDHTTSYTYAELANYFDTSTGKLKAPQNPDTPEKFIGYTWASKDELYTIFSDYGVDGFQYNDFSDAYWTETNDYIDKAIYRRGIHFDTEETYTNYRSYASNGWVRDKVGGNTFVAQINHEENYKNGDRSYYLSRLHTLQYNQNKFKDQNITAWLYKGAASTTVPIPSSVFMLASGLLIIARLTKRKNIHS